MCRHVVTAVGNGSWCTLVLLDRPHHLRLPCAHSATFLLYWRRLPAGGCAASGGCHRNGQIPIRERQVRPVLHRSVGECWLFGHLHRSFHGAAYRGNSTLSPSNSMISQVARRGNVQHVMPAVLSCTSSVVFHIIGLDLGDVT